MIAAILLNIQVSHTEVNGKTLGVVGAGHIGMEVIKVAKALGHEHLSAYTYAKG